MPNRCVVNGCGSYPVPFQISLFKFPGDIYLRARWINFVKHTKEDWNITTTSKICSKHFQTTDFINHQQFSLGYAKLLILKHDAIPSIYPESNLIVELPVQLQRTKSLNARKICLKSFDLGVSH